VKVGTALGVLVAALLALSPAAGATIHLQRGLAGLEVGMTRAQVERVAGRPIRVRRLRNEFGSVTQLFYPHALLVTLQGDRRVTALSTTGRIERTRSGIGVGSTGAQVLRLVPGTRCETTGGFGHCFLGSFTPGARVTDFALKNRRVSRVTVGIVID
jgi:hypothetical protein